MSMKQDLDLKRDLEMQFIAIKSEGASQLPMQEETKGSEAALETEGRKNDRGKPSLSLIPREALETEAQVFSFGAKKYGKSNYKKGMAWSRPLDAALRHINAYASGEDLDPESGLSHLGHARCCLAMLIYYETNKKGKDDRAE